MSKHIQPADAGKQLTAYSAELFRSLAQIKTVYPEQVRELYRQMLVAIAADEPEVLKEGLR